MMDTPVPIPNTEVKLSYAESTCRDTGREDRASPLFIKRAFEIFSMALFFYLSFSPARLTRLFFLPDTIYLTEKVRYLEWHFPSSVNLSYNGKVFKV